MDPLASDSLAGERADEAPGRLAEAWRLALANWPGWLLADSTAVTVMTLPLVLVAALVVVAGWFAGSVPVAVATLQQAAGPLLLAGLAALLWALLYGTLWVAQRLVVMAGCLPDGQLSGRLLRVGWRRYRAIWPRLSGAVLLLCGVAVGLGVTVVFAPVAVLALPLAGFVASRLVLAGDPPAEAFQQSVAAVRRGYGGWLAGCLAVGLGAGGLGFLALACPVGAIVLAVRSPGLFGVLVWLVVALLSHSVLITIAWLVAHVGSLLALLDYQARFGPAGFVAIARALATHRREASPTQDLPKRTGRLTEPGPLPPDPEPGVSPDTLPPDSEPPDTVPPAAAVERPAGDSP